MTNQLEPKKENPEENEGLSEYTKYLAQETQIILDRIIPNNNREKDELEQASEDQNKDFLRACTVFVLSQMTTEEQKDFHAEEFDFRKIIQLAITKSPMSDDIRTDLETQIQNITEQDMQSQTKTNQALELINEKSLISQFYKYLYESFHENPEVDKAYVSLMF